MYRRVSGLLASRGAVLLSTGLAFVGAVTCASCAFAFQGSDVPVLFILLGGALVGIGTPLCLLSVVGIIVWQETETVFMQTIVGAALASALCLVISPCAHLQACLVLCCLPLLMCVGMLFERDRMKRQAVPPRVPTSLSRPRFPTKLFATALVHGTALGTLFGISSAVGSGTSDLRVMAAALASAVALLVVGALGFRLDYSTMLYKRATVFMAVGAAVVVVFDGQPGIGAFVQLVGFCYMHLVVWGLNDFVMREFGIPLVWLVGFTTAGWMCGEVASGLLAGLVVRELSPGYAVDAVETLFLLLLMVASLVLSDGRNLADGWSLAAPTKARAAFPDFDSAVGHLAVVFGLTERESEVFSLFVRGRNRRYIAEALSVSDETVKSHVSAIYRKTGVHTQQEAIDLLEKELIGTSGG